MTMHAGEAGWWSGDGGDWDIALVWPGGEIEAGNLHDGGGTWGVCSFDLRPGPGEYGKRPGGNGPGDVILSQFVLKFSILSINMTSILYENGVCKLLPTVYYLASKHFEVNG